MENINAQPVHRDRLQGSAGVALQQATQLVERYPNLSEIELALLINLYRELSALEVALLMSDSELAPRLGKFVEDNRSKIRTPFREYGMFILIAVLGVVVVIWSVAFAP